MLCFTKLRITSNRLTKLRATARTHVRYEPVGQGFESLAARQQGRAPAPKPSPATGWGLFILFCSGLTFVQSLTVLIFVLIMVSESALRALLGHCFYFGRHADAAGARFAGFINCYIVFKRRAAALQICKNHRPRLCAEPRAV